MANEKVFTKRVSVNYRAELTVLFSGVDRENKGYNIQVDYVMRLGRWGVSRDCIGGI